ncbi:MAG: hypothetical protein ACM3PP_10680 [Candidatus Saccharibacteria bacterium]
MGTLVIISLVALAAPDLITHYRSKEWDQLCAYVIIMGLGLGLLILDALVFDPPRFSHLVTVLFEPIWIWFKSLLLML